VLELGLVLDIGSSEVRMGRKLAKSGANSDGWAGSANTAAKSSVVNARAIRVA
jgi:hypothetical protein